MMRSCHRCGKDFSAPYKEALCEECLKVLGWESTPITNADHIRSMTDEELQRFLCSKMGCNWCDWASARGCLMEEWLKQPYGGDT
jgi:hypothetical protein